MTQSWTDALCRTSTTRPLFGVNKKKIGFSQSCAASQRQSGHTQAVKLFENKHEACSHLHHQHILKQLGRSLNGFIYLSLFPGHLLKVLIVEALSPLRSPNLSMSSGDLSFFQPGSSVSRNDQSHVTDLLLGCLFRYLVQAEVCCNFRSVEIVRRTLGTHYMAFRCSRRPSTNFKATSREMLSCKKNLGYRSWIYQARTLRTAPRGFQ